MEAQNKGGRGHRDPDALRRTGWRPPLLPGEYQDLVFLMFNRSEFKGASTRKVIEAALAQLATEDELKEVGLK